MIYGCCFNAVKVGKSAQMKGAGMLLMWGLNVYFAFFFP